MKVYPLNACKRRLTTVWFSGSGVVFLLFVIQSVLGKYAERLNEAWTWFLPTFLPTLTLMVGVLVADSSSKRRTNRRADPLMYKLAMALSVSYLGVLLLSLLLEPFARTASSDPTTFLKQATLWLAPIQGLATAALGAFFVKTGDGDAEEPGSEKEKQEE